MKLSVDQAADWLRALHKAGLSVAEAVLIVEVARCAQDGEQPALVDITKRLGMPFSTASRIVWHLVERHRLLEQIPDEADRRMKRLQLARNALKRLGLAA